MKKTFRAALALLLVLTLSMSLAACGKTKYKTYAHDGLNITLPSVFKATAQEPYDFAYDSPRAAVFGLRETFEDYPQMKTMTPERYAEITASVNERDNTTDVTMEGDIPVFEFTADNEDDGSTYKYIAGVFKCAEGFWLVQCACSEENFDGLREAFLNYLKSVTVDRPYEAGEDDVTDELQFYPVDDLLLALPWEYSEAELEGVYAAFQNLDSAVLISRDVFADYTNLDLSSYSVEQYLELVRSNQADSHPSETERTPAGVIWFDYHYRHEDETEDYVYFTTAFKSEEAFFLVQYVCGEADYESYQPQFLSWAEQSGFEE